MTFNKYVRMGAYHWRQMDPRWRNSRFNPPLVARYKALVDRIPKDARRILEVGSGDGALIYASWVAHPQATYVGVDTDEVGITLAERELEVAGVPAKVIDGSAYDLPFEDASFDAVLFADVVEHLDQPELAIREICRVLRSGGTLLLSTPHAQPDIIWDAEHHVKEYVREDLDALLSSHFTSCSLRGVYPMKWMRTWRRNWVLRSWIRSLARVGRNPLTQEGEATADYGQLIATCRK